MVIKFLDLPEESTICKHCGEITQYDSMIWLNGEMYCPDCYKKVRFPEPSAAAPAPDPKPKKDPKHNGGIIKELRSETGLSQKKFADKFEIPVASLQNWEAGRTAPPPYVLFMIKSILALEGSEKNE